MPLGLLNSFMSKQLPHSKKVYTIHHRMGSEGMAQCVKGHSLQAYLLNDPAHGVNEPIETPVREPFTDRCWAFREDRLPHPTQGFMWHLYDE
jgi:hypothetical protein